MTELLGWEIHRTDAFSGGTCKIVRKEGTYESAVMRVDIVHIALHDAALRIEVPDGQLPGSLVTRHPEGFEQSSCIMVALDYPYSETEFQALLLDGGRALISRPNMAVLLTPPHH